MTYSRRIEQGWKQNATLETDSEARVTLLTGGAMTTSGFHLAVQLERSLERLSAQKRIKQTMQKI